MTTPVGDGLDYKHQVRAVASAQRRVRHPGARCRNPIETNAPIDYEEVDNNNDAIERLPLEDAGGEDTETRNNLVGGSVPIISSSQVFVLAATNPRAHRCRSRSEDPTSNRLSGLLDNAKLVILAGLFILAIGIAGGVIGTQLVFSSRSQPVLPPSPETTDAPETTDDIDCLGYSPATTYRINRENSTDVRDRGGGTIPTCLGQLTRLTFLSLASESLMGPIPTELGQLTALTELWLYNNQLTGTLPTELGQLTALKVLWLHGNPFKGTLPTELGQLTSLVWLYLHNGKQLGGPIPTELGQLTALTQLWLSSNTHTGTLPTELGHITALQRLSLDSNENLAGPLPTELGRLTALTRLDAYNNRLSGTIPSELQGLTALEWLWLQNNELSGSVPDFASTIGTLNLSGNTNLTV